MSCRGRVDPAARIAVAMEEEKFDAKAKVLQFELTEVTPPRCAEPVKGANSARRVALFLPARVKGGVSGPDEPDRNHRANQNAMKRENVGTRPMRSTSL